MKFRKIPVVIEATQMVTGQTIPDGVVPKDGRNVIETMEGDMEVSEGDWVITGVKGERYPCKPDIFALTYELAE